MGRSGGIFGIHGASWALLGGTFGKHFGAILKLWEGFRSQVRLGRRLGRVLADFKGQDDSNLKPKRAPSCSQNNLKIDAKIDRNIDGFGNRFLKGFWTILVGKMEASWNQNGIKFRSYLENAAKQKVLIKPMEFQWFCGTRGHKLEAKIDPKSIRIWSPRWSASWHRFLIDFGGFLVASWDGKSIKNQSKNASKNRCHKEDD